MPRIPLRALLALALFATAAGTLVAADDTADTTERDALEEQFGRTVQPFLKNWCLDCHGSVEPEAKLDLSVYTQLGDVAEAQETWSIVLQRLEAGEMPPSDALQPTDAQRDRLIEWIRNLRRSEAVRRAGDPGPVLVRRLSNAEYNYTIRDLTGVDIRPTETFPVDPANAAGFDNSGESLSMSPALLNKYLAAARYVTEHLVLQPEGFTFAPHPVMTNTDRDKYCVKQIVEFYRRQPTDYADYFFAAWKFRESAGTHDVTLTELAAAEGISARYLQTVWNLLNESTPISGPLGKLRTMWQELPTDRAKESAARDDCEAMRDYVKQIREQLQPAFENLMVEGSHKGSQPFVLWKNRQYAAHRQTYDPAALREPDSATDKDVPGELILPADPSRREAYQAALRRFCETFPDAFYISERGRDYLGKPRSEQEKGRLLSAGFHSMMGYFRDDGPLDELILTESEQQELDRLWQQLDFVTFAPHRQYSGFLWFERTDSRYMRDPEFDFARAEDKSATTESMIKRLAKVYLAKARRNGGSDVAIQAIEDYFDNINAQIRWVESARLKAQPSHLEALLEFAARASRRRLTDSEQQELLAFYRTLREQDGLSHEEALQDTMVSILMSPHFCYRLDLGGLDQLAATVAEPTDETASRVPLTDYELASRLSYFLWSSMPDAELLDVAAAGQLQHPEMLLQQARRMMHDPRVRGLATEFTGNWLDFRRFEEHNSVDRNRFPMFTEELRQAMFEEPIRFFIDIVQNDRSVLEFLYADHTFVNRVLAEHYGIEELEFDSASWQRLPRAGRYSRGGLLPMSVFLTQNAPGLRTSPVKRGYWVVRRLLGERIPAPPPNVPELPNDESQLGDLTLREVLARHREHKSCAGCHERFDSIGLVFEGFGPVGERRKVDLGGRTVQTAATFPDGETREGLSGLRDYLQAEREQDFLENLCRKLLSYALSRSLILSDDLLIEKMQERLATDEYRFRQLVETIILSPQFRERRSAR